MRCVWGYSVLIDAMIEGHIESPAERRKAQPGPYSSKENLLPNGTAGPSWSQALEGDIEHAL